MFGYRGDDDGEYSYPVPTSCLKTSTFYVPVRLFTCSEEEVLKYFADRKVKAVAARKVAETEKEIQRLEKQLAHLKKEVKND